MTPSCFPLDQFICFSLFSHREGGGGIEGYRVGRLALKPRGVTAKEAKQQGSTDAVKRCSKNDFICHSTPCMTRPIRRGNMATVSEMGLMIVVGSTKAQGSKAKLVYDSELPRATRVRDKAIQRIANILAHPMPHRGDPTSSTLAFESRLGGFLHAPMWVGI
jgi:hypothetical protein